MRVDELSGEMQRRLEATDAESVKGLRGRAEGDRVVGVNLHNWKGALEHGFGFCRMKSSSCGRRRIR